MRFIEETEAAWSAEQLAAAEREIEEQKLEWEQNRLAAMREEAERRAREIEEENDLLTFPREDATNQVSDNIKKINKRDIVRKRVGKAFRNRRIKNRRLNNLRNTRNGKNVKVRCHYNRRLRRRLKMVNKKSIEVTEKSKNENVKNQKVVVEAEVDNSMDSTHSNTNSLEENEIHTNGDVNDTASENSNYSSSEDTKIVENFVDHNSPRTRSRGTVAINLWTLDVSPILPGIKPIKNYNLTYKRDRHKNKDDTESESDDAIKKISGNMTNVDGIDKKTVVVENETKRHFKKRNGTKSIIAADDEEEIAKLDKLDDTTTLADLRRALAKKLNDSCKNQNVERKGTSKSAQKCNTVNDDHTKNKNSTTVLKNVADNITLNEIEINCTMNCKNDEIDNESSLKDDITKENLNKINDDFLHNKTNNLDECKNLTKNAHSPKLQPKNTAMSTTTTALTNNDLDKLITTTKPKRVSGRKTKPNFINNERQNTLDGWITMPSTQKTTRVDQLDNELTLIVASKNVNHDSKNEIDVNDDHDDDSTNNKRNIDDAELNVEIKNSKIIKTD